MRGNCTALGYILVEEGGGMGILQEVLAQKNSKLSVGTICVPVL